MRLGRILSGEKRTEKKIGLLLYILGGAKGPGLFFILPCVDSIMKVDLRTSECQKKTQNISLSKSLKSLKDLNNL
jgi:hypothetical protein